MLSRITGQDVLAPDGRVAGRLADLTVRLDKQASPHLVERLRVECHRPPDLFLRWADGAPASRALLHCSEDASYAPGCGPRRRRTRVGRRGTRDKET